MDWQTLLIRAAIGTPTLLPTLLRALADQLEAHPELVGQLLKGKS